jgi:Tol biopolymer transport system component
LKRGKEPFSEGDVVKGRIVRAAAAAALIAGLPAPAHTSPIPPEPQLWVVGRDGGGETMLTESWSLDAPEWSPDGEHLVYVRGGLFVADADGGNERRLTPDGESAARPAWSPDGRWIAYTSYGSPEGHPGGLTLIGPDGSERRHLANLSASALSWSPDSTRLAYVRGTPGQPGGLYVLDVTTGVETLVKASAALYSATEWSPDGGLIAFQAWSWELHAIAPDGSGERQLSQDGFVDSFSWSPDGSQIVYGIDGDIYIAARDGSSRRRLTEGVTPDWGPNGDIAFARDGDLYRIDPAGTGEVRITEDHLREDYRPEWSPDGFRIAFIGTPVQVLCGSFPFPVQATIIGTDGADRLEGTPGTDVIAGRGGDDVILGLGGDDLICGDDGDDRLEGGDGNDFLDGDAGSDTLDGGAGSDTLIGGLGDDGVAGGAGRDVVSFAGATAPIEVDLARGRATGQGQDSIADVEDADGGPRDDVLKGTSGPNRLRGSSFRWLSSGDDTIIGRGGPDRLAGRDGRDVLRGGAGRDRLDGGKNPTGRGDLLGGGRGIDRCLRGEHVRSCER